MKIKRIETNPEFAAAKALYLDLQAKHDAAEARAQAIQMDLANTDTSGERALTTRARSLLEGTTPPATNNLRDELTKAWDAVHVLREAVRLQANAVEELRAKLSIGLRETVMDEHRKHMARVIEAVNDLMRANAAERDFHEAIREAGYNDLTPHASEPTIGTDRDRASLGNVYLLNLARVGLIDPSLIHENARALIPPKTHAQPALVTSEEGWT